MSEPMSVAVWVGGSLPHDLIEAFIAAATFEGLGFDWDEGHIQDEADIRAHIEDGEPLALNDPQCNYGDVESFLTFCQEHNLAYRYQCDPRYEFDGETRVWLPGWESEKSYASTSGGAIQVSCDSLVSARNNGKTLDDVIADLTVPELPAFVLVASDVPVEA